jgi:DedD protein
VQEAGVADRDEAQDFKRRARRRLIGAIALVLFLVIVPPWIMEREPKPSLSGLSVEIPSQDAKRPPLRVSPPVAKPEEKPAAPPEKLVKSEDRAGDAGTPEPRRTPPEPAEPEPAKPHLEAPVRTEKPAEKPVKPPEAGAATTAKPAARDSVRKSDAERAEALLAGAPSATYVVPVGTYASAEGVKQVQARLSGIGIKSYTEAAGNGRTRVRAGPFTSREAADRARDKLAGAGFKPGAVVARK